MSGTPRGRQDRDRAVYVISVAAELAGVHPQTLRAYERKGLIRPWRTAGGTRRYSLRDVERVRLIQRLTRADGVNLAGVQRILQMQDELERLRGEVADLRAELARVTEAASRRLEERRRAASTDIVLYRRPAAIQPGRTPAPRPGARPSPARGPRRPTTEEER